MVIADDAADREWMSVPTADWHPLSWGRELMKRDVARLVCSGIDRATWGAIRGHGIDVIPDAAGELQDVFSAWRAGLLKPPADWPSAMADGWEDGPPFAGGGLRSRWRRGRPA